MSPIKIVSLSHSDDFDGIGSQAIIYRYFTEMHKPIPPEFGQFPEENTELILMQSDYSDYLFYWAAILAGLEQKTSNESLDFEKTWESMIFKLHDVHNMESLEKNFATVSPESKKLIIENTELWKNIDLLILSDIGYNKTFKTLFPLLKEWNLPIAYFDHHTHDEETQEFFSKYCRVYNIDTKRCATQIVHDFFLPEDKISQYISNLGFDTDFNKFRMENSREIMSIISHYRKDFKKLNEIVKEYAKGTYFDSRLDKVFQQVEKWEDSQFTIMKKTLKKIELKNPNAADIFVIMGISKLRSGRSMHKLDEIYDDAWLHAEKPNINSLLLFTIDQKSMNTNINSETLNVHKIAEHFGGGGHIHRAGFRFPSSYIKTTGLSAYTFDDIKIDEFLDEVKKIL